MDEERKKKLKKYREKVLQIMGKPELAEQKEMNDHLKELKEILLSQDKVDTSLVEKKLDKIAGKLPIKIEQKEVVIPSKMEAFIQNWDKMPTQIKVNIEKALPNLSVVVDKLDEILHKEPIKIEQKEFKLPEVLNTKITNWPDKPNKVEVVNLDQAPKTEIDLLKPIKWLWSRTVEFFEPIVDYVIEPKKIEIKENEIVEYYTNKKVIYRLGRNVDDEINKIERIVKNES